MRHIVTACLLVFLSCVAASAGTVYFLNPNGSLQGVQRPGTTIEDAVRALVAGTTASERLAGLASAIPEGTTVLGVTTEGGEVIVNLGGVPVGLWDDQVDAIIGQIAALGEATGEQVSVRFDGRTSDAVRMPELPVIPRAVGQVSLAAGALAGKKITVSPGHGWVWLGTYYATQRGINCGLEQEDFHNLRISQYLNTYLEQDGAIVYRTRETDMSRGNHPLSAKPWWQMAAPFYLYDKGYPQSVYSAVTNTAQPGVGSVNQLDDDRRSRAEASNYDGTDLYLSLHTNAFQGDCNYPAPPASPSCPTGIEMYADQSQLGGYYNQSLTLAQKAQTAIYAAVRSAYQPSYPCRNNCTPRTNQAFTEIHYPRRPACLLEFGFHDSCITDVVALKDEVFRSAGMWGYYKGVCDYYGVTPTWDLRSYEVVSSEFPTIVKAGSSFAGRIVLRNRGVLWNEQHQFRLGSINNNAAFGPTRVTLAAPVGPTELATFDLNLTAPATDGYHTTAWRMVQDEFGIWFGPGAGRAIKVDATGPTAPSPVDDGGPYQTSTTQIAASWAASTDAGIGLDHYEYRLLDSAMSPLTGWTSSGTTTSALISASLAKGQKYFVQVRALDAYGFSSAAVTSPGVIVVHDTLTVGEAKGRPDGDYVALAGVVLTAVLTDHSYVQAPDRSSGIRIDASPSLSPGEGVDVAGRMATSGYERVLSEAHVTPLGPAALPAPLGMNLKQLGGEALNALTPGVSLAYGLHNVGLRVRVFGWVSQVGADGFRINDGGVSSGVWVSNGAFHKPAVGEFAMVTGIAAVDGSNGERLVKVSADADVTP